MCYRAARAGIITGALLAVARISGETAPLLFTALNNQFWSANLNAPMASLPVVIFQFALSPYADWQKLAWTGALIITVAVLALSIRRPNPRRIAEAIMTDAATIAVLPLGRIPEAEGLVERVSVRNLDFYYNQHHALKSINLSLYDRKVTTFIGPSGCGKSTLLRVLNRMYDLYPNQRGHRRGALCRCRHPVAGAGRQHAARPPSAWCSRSRRPFPMTIYENIAFGIRMYERLPRAELDVRVEQALRRTALWDEVKDKLAQSGLSLSGGQQQRLCIARTIAVRPQVILFDEPCSALDPISTARIEELFDELKDDYTLIVVTHNMQQAARISDFTAFMYLGELVEFDTTRKVFTKPAEKRTQDYITGRFG